MANQSDSNVPQSIRKPKLLLCQSSDQKAVLEKTLSVLNISDVQVETYFKGGADSSIKTLQVRDIADSIRSSFENLATEPKEKIEKPSGSIITPKLLLCEGPDDLEIFNALLSVLEIKDVVVETYLGVDKLSSALKTLKKRPGFGDLVSLGITRDADYRKKSEDSSLSAMDAFRSVSNFLKDLGYSVPSEMGAKVEEQPSVSTFIFPDCQAPGALEDLLLSAVEADPSAACSSEFLKCLESNGVHPPKTAVGKIRMLTWAAPWLKPRSPQWRDAIDHIDFNHSAFDKLKDFLKNL